MLVGQEPGLQICGNNTNVPFRCRISMSALSWPESSLSLLPSVLDSPSSAVKSTVFHDETQRGLSASTSKECGVGRPTFLTFFLCSAVRD